MSKRILVLLIFVIIVISATACTTDIVYAEPEVVSIAVNGIFKTDDYIVGDELDISTATIVATYSNGKIEVVPLEYSMLSKDFSMSVPEENKEIKVTYKQATASFFITVHDLDFDTVTLLTLPNKLKYIEGENISSQGATISVNYKGGKTVIVDVTDKMLQNYDKFRLGPQDILISYFGRPLSFSVTFLPKTVKAITVLREPYQNTVFKSYGDSLSLAGMKLKLIYDNGLTPEAVVSDIEDSVRVYLDDSEARTVEARVAYLPPSYPAEVVYEYLGNPMVSVGDHVYPDLALASNIILDDELSKTYGKVTSIEAGIIKISTIVEYQVSSTSLKVGQIVLNNELLGKYGSNNVFCIGGGVVTSIDNGIVTLQTAPTSKFNINVKNRSFENIEILTYPKTIKNETDTRTQSIIQGDTLDLSTGRVRVYFDNGEQEDYAMNSTLIKVVNSLDDMLRSEINDLVFNSVDDVEGLGEGRYQLLYDITHPYGENGVTTIVTVIDEDGNDIYVQENRFVSLQLGKNYTVSITVSRFSEGVTLVSETNYSLATIGAGVKHRQLDISAAGQHSLIVYYGGVLDNSAKFTVNVSQKTPVSLILEEGTNNISNRIFYKGDTIPLTSLRYKLIYNNGDESQWSGVTLGMLGEGCTLTCDVITQSKVIFFTVIGSSHVKSADLICKVEPMPIKEISFTSVPYNLFLTATAGGNNNIDLSGGVLRIYYQNNTVQTIGNVVGQATLPDLINAPSGNKIEFDYASEEGGEIPSTAFTPEQIYSGEADSYRAKLIYTDTDGASAVTYLDYYIYYIQGASKSVTKITADYRVGQYKVNYIQSEEWDLSDIKIIVNYSDGTTSVIPATKEMVYQSSTKTIGSNIPLKFAYLGKIYSGTLTYNVESRVEKSLSVKTNGKVVYFTTDRNIDLSTYRFIIGYNAGAPEEIVGVTTFGGGYTTVGWWYELINNEEGEQNGMPTVLNRDGEKLIRLHHTSLVGTNYRIITCDIPITVYVNTSGITSIEYIPEPADAFYNVSVTVDGFTLPVLAEVAAGWEIMFSDYDSANNRVFKKYITIHYADGSTGYAEFDNAMLNYNTSELTAGYRKVIINYKGATCEVAVLVNKALLDRIEIETKPLTNYISGSSLSLYGGVLRLVFREVLGNGDIRYMYKYIDMDNEQVKTEGFTSVIDTELDHQVQTINLSYKPKDVSFSTSFDVVVYNKQDVVFHYQNTIFFYGRTKSAQVEAFRAVPEFTLPLESDIIMRYVCNIYFMEEADINTYLAANPTRAIDNILRITIGYDEQGKPIFKYVDELYAQVQYFYAPAPRGYDYYIMMTVNGNVYYKDANYCLQKYTVIPKVIAVTAINASEYAYIYRIKTENIPATVSYLYNLSFDDVRSHFSELTYITGLEMVSPNANYLEIMLSVNTTFVETPEIYEQIQNVFNYIKGLIQSNVVIDKTKPIEEQVNVIVSNYDSFSVDGISKGVNIGEFEGGKPSFISYRIDKGETLTLGGVMDLLNNTPDLQVVDGKYDLGTYRIVVGELSHNNYNIDFVSANYIVNRRMLSGYQFNVGISSGSLENGDLTLTIMSGQQLSLTLMYVNTINGASSYTVLGSDYKVSYYEEGVLLESVPASAGEYEVVILNCYADSDGDEFAITFTMIIN